MCNETGAAGVEAVLLMSVAVAACALALVTMRPLIQAAYQAVVTAILGG